jgi:ABC-type nitrate/sulfonate/bicarbonate transport system substrate-binding protein
VIVAVRAALATMVAMALAFALPGRPAHAAGAPFRVGIAAPTVNMLPLWVGEDAGLFTARGLNVSIVNTDGGSRGLAEVGAGKLEIMTVGLSAVIEANGQGGDYRLIASSANTMSFDFFGATGITNASALAGRAVGVSAFSSESDLAASLALKQLGLSRSEVRVVEAGGTVKRLDALRHGDIAATALNEPAASMAERAGLPKLVALSRNLPWIFTGIVADRRMLETQRGQFEDFLRAYVEAIALALSDEARAKRVLAAHFAGVTPDVLAVTYADFRARVPRDAMPSREGAETMLREEPAFGAIVKSADLRDYVDFSLIDDLSRSGYIDATLKKYGVAAR